MKTLTLLFLLICLVISGCQNISTHNPIEQYEDSTHFDFLKANGQVLVGKNSEVMFRIRAINFTHDPTASEYKDARALGFNTVRLTLDIDQTNVKSNYPWLDTQIQYAREADVYLILSLHVNQSTLWTNTTGHQPIIDFWEGVAEQYATEEVIAAYDLLGTPSPLNLNQWQLLAEEIAGAIRSTDTNHPLIVQAALIPDRTFIYLNDENYILGFDFFKPFEFTGLNRDKYPNNKLFQPPWNNFQLTGFIRNPKLAEGTTDWTETSTSLNLIVDREAVIGLPGVACNNLLGSAWFSNFVVNEFDETAQSSREILSIDLAQSNFWGPWSGDNSLIIKKVDDSPWGEIGKSFLFTPNQEGRPASGTIADTNFAFELVPGRSYTIHGWMRGENVNADADCKFNIEFYSYAGKDSLIVWDKEHLQREFERIVKYGQFHNLPMMLVDFGISQNTLGNGGEAWAQDMFDLLGESSLSYAWKSYRDNQWGLYSVTGTSVSNLTLTQLFQRSMPEVISSENQKDEDRLDMTISNGFIHARGQNLVVGTPEEIIYLKGINFNNALYTKDFPHSPRHDRRDFFAVRNMGFNVIRFNLTYQWFTENPEQGWVWLDQQIVWAKEAGIYLIINMHYVPGQDIWTISYDSEVQKQTAELWRMIADRYKDETIIAGYDLLNEPINVASSVYQAYMQRVVDAIREVDSNHLIIVEAINEYTPRFVTVNDDNVMYDFHFYHPVDLTHENVNGSLDTKTYPDVDFLELRWDRLKLLNVLHTDSIQAGYSDWIEYESPLINVGKQENAEAFGYPILYCNNNRGRAYFGNFQILAIEAGSTNSTMVMDISINSETPINKGYDGGSAIFGLSPEYNGAFSDGRSLTIRESTGRAWFEFYRNAFEVQSNTKYQIKGWMKGDNISYDANCYYAIEFFQLDPRDKLLRHDRDFLAERLEVGIQFRNQNNVPINVGEFGVFHTAFLNPEAGGARWTSDMLDLLIANNINFAYWDYDGEWGLYPDQVHYPDLADINEAMMKVFLEKVAPLSNR